MGFVTPSGRWLSESGSWDALERAALDIQSGSAQNRLTLIYRLSEIIVNLLEMHLSRP